MNLSACLLLAATQLFAVEALLVQVPDPGPRPKDRLHDGESLEFTDTKARHLPDLDRFRHQFFEDMMPADPVPEVPGVKLVMGVFTMWGEEHYREVIRSTWMTVPRVCKAREGEREGCSVYVTFVQGQTAAGLLHGLADLDQDMVVLPLEENVNGGKTLSYFRFALEKYPWATHFGKMDTDVFPKWSRIVGSFKGIPDGCESYLGRPWTCYHPIGVCPQESCAPQDDGQIRAHNGTVSDSCWFYMQGGLYIVSRDLLDKATERNGHWEKNAVGPEDLMAGHAIVRAAEEYNMCVQGWPKPLAQPEVAYFHFMKVPGPCPTTQWASYYGLWDCYHRTHRGKEK